MAALAPEAGGSPLVAGADVARRALDPALPLRPGFVAYSTDLPKGTAQDAFAALAALLRPRALMIAAPRCCTVLMN